jgi:putative intracellular protease/amidase
LRYPGLTALDAVGPYEVLRLLPDAEVRFVAAAPGPVVTDSGVLFLGATHSYAETPSPDLVLVPGSGPRTATAMADTELLDWLRQVHETSRWTTSVCTGAMILAAAGILAGLDLGLWLAGEIAGRKRAETIQRSIEYDPHPPFDADRASKVSKAVVGNAKTLGLRVGLNPSEARAVPTIAWQRMGRQVPQAKRAVMNGTAMVGGSI